MFSKSSIIAFTLASVARGHMLMNTPSPYTSPALHNGPLEASGSDFPCQLSGGSGTLSGGSTSSYALGSTQQLKFTGSAVHGGGSCQVSITYDSSPSKNSVWKAITSIEGGCPAQGQSGNMGDNAAADDPYTYNFTVPTNIPTGKVTLAWTWFNKIGNREMYMNCAPVELTGTGGTESDFNSLPDMFVANIGNGCGTVDSTDLLFPNPGSEVQSLNGATTAFSTPTGTGCQAAGAVATTAKASVTTSAKASVTSVKASAITSAKTSGTIPGGVFVTVSGSAAAGTSVAATSVATSAAKSSVKTSSPVATSSPAKTTSVAQTKTTSVVAGTTTTSAATATGTGTSTVSGAQTPGSACTTEGQFICLGSSYQQCASGTWSVAMTLASGTQCDKTSSSLSISAIQSRRRKLRAVKNNRVARKFRA